MRPNDFVLASGSNLTARDYFAAEAMAAIISSSEEGRGNGLYRPSTVAEKAYVYADCMIAARLMEHQQ